MLDSYTPESADPLPLKGRSRDRGAITQPRSGAVNQNKSIKYQLVINSEIYPAIFDE